MGFFDKLKTVADGAVVAIDQASEKIARKLTDDQLLSRLSKKPNNKYFRAEAERRGLI